MPNILKNIFFILVACFVSLETKLQNIIDLNDILSSSYMPGTLLMLEQLPNRHQASNRTLLDIGNKEISLDGSINKALDTMKFHRLMMNQYMCRSYVADQILSEINRTKFKKRMGQAPPTTMQDKPLFAEKIKNNLLLDQGSLAYQNWLSKTATLEDIYQNHNKIENRDDNLYLENEAGEEEEKADDNTKNYNVNGFNFKLNTGKAVKIGQRGQNTGIYYLGGENYYPDHHGFNEHVGLAGTEHSDEHSIYENGHAIEHEPVVYSRPTKHYLHYTGSSYDKTQELADIFEIALTALAYLSFGMFIVHLIMSISAVKNNATTTAAAMMMPMSMSPTAATATGTGGGNGGNDTGTTGGGNAPSAPGMGGMPGTGGGSTSTGGGATGTGATGTGGGVTGTGGGTTGTGGGANGTGGGATGNGGDSTGTGGGATGTGGFTTGAGGGTTSTGGATSTGGGSTSTGGGTTGGGNTSTGGGTTSTGSGATSTGTGATTGTVTGSTGTGDVSTGGGTGMDGTASGTATGAGDGMDTFKFRLKREIPKLTSPNNVVLNEMAKKILSSIDAALVAYSDNGECLQKSLCTSNKYSRSLNGLNKLIIPVWSLGMSWVTGTLTTNSSSKSRIDGLKAAVLGLGMANCETIYQRCDIKKAKHLTQQKK